MAEKEEKAKEAVKRHNPTSDVIITAPAVVITAPVMNIKQVKDDDEGVEKGTDDADMDPAVQSEPLDMTEEEALAEIEGRDLNDIDADWDDGSQESVEDSEDSEDEVLDLAPSDEVADEDAAEAESASEDTGEDSEDAGDDDVLELEPADEETPVDDSGYEEFTDIDSHTSPHFEEESEESRQSYDRIDIGENEMEVVRDSVEEVEVEIESITPEALDDEEAEDGGIEVPAPEAAQADGEEERSTSLPPPVPPAADRDSSQSRPPPVPKIPDHILELSEPGAVRKRKRRRKKLEWWAEIFDDAYLRSLPRYTERDTRREVDFIESCLGVEKDGKILDIGCGQGRHAVELAARRYQVVGIDFSLPMLARAGDLAQEKDQKINFIHQDMRELDYDKAFDAAYCVGTSFGFFDDETNEKVIKGIHGSLKPRGLFFLEVANRDFIINNQPNLIWFEGDGCACMEETDFNFITSRLRVKRTILIEETGRQIEHEFSIRLYSLHELGRMLHENGFRVAEASGHAASPGAFFGADSARLMILAERRA